jgi:actin-related protein 6
MTMTGPQSPLLVMDQGGASIKVGWASPGAENPDLSSYRCIPNCTTKKKGDTRGYVADQLDERDETSGLIFRRPFEKGYLCNWDIQREIWDRIFSKDVMNVSR